MTHSKTLLVVWQNGITRSYYHVGTLTYKNNIYTFSYTNGENGKLKDALDNGYMLHPAFPYQSQIYQSKSLFVAFDRRLPSKEREDFKDIIKDLGINHPYDKIDLLEATRGRLATDTYSFERPLITDENEKTISTSFFVHGMRYQELPKNWSEQISEGSHVYFKHEKDNDHDQWAIAIYSKDNFKLGYVPRFYSKAIHSLLNKKLTVRASVTYINEKSTSNWWMKIKFACDLNKEHPTIESIVEPIMSK